MTIGIYMRVLWCLLLCMLGSRTNKNNFREVVRVLVSELEPTMDGYVSEFMSVTTKKKSEQLLIWFERQNRQREKGSEHYGT